MSKRPTFPNQPPPFLEVRVHDLKPLPAVTGLCVGYERTKWRATQFADHVMEWLPEFALNYSELVTANSGNLVALVREAAQKVYKTEKFRKRGEFGEILLHIALRQVFQSIPAISKIFYKSARNDTIKGFDAVHAVGSPPTLELWLGEAKFYNDFAAAARDVVADIKNHSDTSYLRDEFILIRGKIDPASPHAAAINSLLSKNKSLDSVFSRVCIPVLLTYDSECLGSYSSCTKEYIAAFTEEIRRHRLHFSKLGLPKELTVHLILLPLNTKDLLLTQLEAKLKHLQKI